MENIDAGNDVRRGARIVDNDPNLSGPGPQVMAARTLQGNPVRNPRGEDLGEIQDIMLNVPDGRIAYAVLSFGSVLGMGGKLFAIPWRALTLDADQECFVLDISKERLQDAPGFDEDHWPSMADPLWVRKVDDFYNSPQ
jgi:sporulation protein YlmC with PRC-barrel domain